MKDTLGNIDVVILCGGKGERLKSISGELPKALVRVAGRPFIDFLLKDLYRQGFHRIILSIGYGRNAMRNYCSAAGYDIEFSEEETPLGTGGAVKKAGTMIHSPSFVVINGDSICPVNFSGFHQFHIQKGGALSFVLVRPKPGQDYGVIEMNNRNRITNFSEKTQCGREMFINGGIYCMRQDVLDHMPKENSFSLERDFFPKILDIGCYGMVSDADLIDIGTPERYAFAQIALSSRRF